MPQNDPPKVSPPNLTTGELSSAPADQSPARPPSPATQAALDKLRGSVLHYADPTAPVWGN
jgi:hypothetical protein